MIVTDPSEEVVYRLYRGDTCAHPADVHDEPLPGMYKGHFGFYATILREKEQPLKIQDVLDAVGNPGKTITAIQPSLIEHGALVDITLHPRISEGDREDIIHRMEMAGYKLRGDELGTLTFLKEVD